MTHEELSGNELPFPSDFAARVMAEADAITARRRATRSAFATIAVVAVAVLAWQVWPSSAPDTQRIPREIVANGNVGVADYQTPQPTLLDFVFPDAAALSQFSEQYDDSEDSGVEENDAVFFPDAEDEAVLDNS